MGKRRDVGAAFAACGVDVALDGVLRLVARLVQRAQIHPGGGVAVVQLHGADVGLQSVHGLVLLLVQHPEEEGRGSNGAETKVSGEGGEGRVWFRVENGEKAMMRTDRRNESVSPHLCFTKDRFGK